MPHLYPYVGPPAVRERAAGRPTGSRITSAAELLAWARDTRQCPGRDGLIPATFVVTVDGELRVADRRSEHVACAGGGPVLSAGELFFAVTAAGVEVLGISNLSTGYCPEPESWPAVARALERAGIAHPGEFTAEAVFRRCEGCGERNVVRDGYFVCGVCGASVPRAWNF